MKELLDSDESYEYLGESWQNEEERPLMGRFEESSSKMTRLLSQREELVLIEREKGFELISGLDTDEQQQLGLHRDSITSIRFLSMYKERPKRYSGLRIAIFALLFALFCRIFNAESLVMGDELLLGVILSLLLERSRQEKRQSLLIEWTENGKEEYLRLSFRVKGRAKEQWTEFWDRS